MNNKTQKKIIPGFAIKITKFETTFVVTGSTNIINMGDIIFPFIVNWI